MSNNKFIYGSLETKLALDKSVSAIFDRLSESESLQFRNNIAHSLLPKVTVVSKAEKYIKELEEDLYKGWQSSNAGGYWEDFRMRFNPRISTEDLEQDETMAFKFQTGSPELRLKLENLNEIYGRPRLGHHEITEYFGYELRKDYDTQEDYFSAEDLYAAFAKVDFKDYVDTFLNKIRVEIRILWKAVTQLTQIDKRTNHRNMIQFLFKNLDDAHSYVNNSLSFLINYLDITHYDTRKYTGAN